MSIPVGTIVRLKDGKESATVRANEIVINNSIVEGGLYLDKPLQGMKYWNEQDVVVMPDKSHLTAITRRNLPGPTQWLIKKGLLTWSRKTRILDYGCGKAHELNNGVMPMSGYDPYHRPRKPRGHFNIIICNYVLCVLPTAEKQMEVIRNIQDLLTPDGVAYISVRNDKPKTGHGFSRTGTFQAEVWLDIPVIRICRQFRTYKLGKYPYLTSHDSIILTSKTFA